LPSKRELPTQPDKDLECLIVDVLVQEIERPLKKQKPHLSYKKNVTLKKHKFSYLLIPNVSMHLFGSWQTTGFFSFQAKPNTHPPHFQLLADFGLKGLARIHSNCQIPKKKTKLSPLKKEHKNFNRQLPKTRIFALHLIRYARIRRLASPFYA
jgi:hypothetical protein